jgi:hypothetical protein
MVVCARMSNILKYISDINVSPYCIVAGRSYQRERSLPSVIYSCALLTEHSKQLYGSLISSAVSLSNKKNGVHGPQYGSMSQRLPGRLGNSSLTVPYGAEGVLGHIDVAILRLNSA